MKIEIFYNQQGEENVHEIVFPLLTTKPSVGRSIYKFHKKMQLKKLVTKWKEDGLRKQRTSYVRDLYPSDYQVYKVVLYESDLAASAYFSYEDFKDKKTPDVLVNHKYQQTKQEEFDCEQAN